MKNEPDKKPENDATGKKPEGDKKGGLFKKIKDTFNRASKQEWRGIFKHTLKDLRNPKEILLLAGSSFIPGGWVGYGTYRIAKYNLTKPANDNKPPLAGPKPAEKPAKKPKKQPKPPGKG